MKLPVIEGLIDRRILVNFTVDPDVVSRIIPPHFRPKLYKGKAIAGICLIRLKDMRPKGLPGFIGVSSENGAHRLAVEWMGENGLEEGVFIPRRDTSCLFNTVAGGRIFPGKHHLAKFDVKEENGCYHVAFTSADGTSISIDGERTDQLDAGSVFEDLEAASLFFQKGSVGFSPNGTRYDGLELKTTNWKIEALRVTAVHSSFFEDTSLFPPGTVCFDNALLMTGITHEWHSVSADCLC